MTSSKGLQQEVTFSHEVAKVLLDEGAVAINTTQPFVYASGIISPIYCDLRILMSAPRQRERIVELLVTRILENCNESAVDVVAGVATAGIPWAAWIARAMNKPMAYVREQAKGHGKGQQVEGGVGLGQKVIVVEDLTSTGGSALNAVEALRGVGAQADNCFSTFTYEFTQTADAFQQARVGLVSLCGVSTLLEVATSNGQITAEQEHAVKEWLAREPMGDTTDRATR